VVVALRFDVFHRLRIKDDDILMHDPLLRPFVLLAEPAKRHQILPERPTAVGKPRLYLPGVFVFLEAAPSHFIVDAM